MAQIINIAGLTPVEDPEYRYKMHRVIGKVEGRGNGIKTVIPNMVLVAQTLHRPPGEVTKFFGCELGAQTTYNDETERAIVNGAHETRVLQEKLSIYIEKFVLCPNCKLPETMYKVKSGLILHNCAACGAREMVDMEHKLTTYILKQHQLDKKAKAKDSKKGDKKDKKDKKDKGGDDEGDEKKKKKKDKKDKKGDDDEDDEAKKKRKAEKKAKKAAKEAKKAGGGGGGDESDDESEEEEDPAGAALDSAIRGLRLFVSAGKTAPDCVSELRAVQTFCALPRQERGYILCAAVFTEAVAAEIEAKGDLCRAFCKDATPYSLIGGLEKLAAVTFPALAPKFALVLKAAYDADVLEEDDLLAWHAAGVAGVDRDIHVPDSVDDAKRASLLAAAEPFVNWLKEADEDTEED